MKSSAARWRLPVLLGFTLALHVPFLNQAFHMDDGQYIDLARNALVHPWFPNDMPYVFDGYVLNMAGHSHPPLNAYLLALVWKLSGRLTEPLAHGFYLLFPLLATWAFFSLARRFTRWPVAATLLFATVPPLVVMSHTVMADVPMLALMLAGIACFFPGIEEERSGLLVLAALALSLAAFSSYFALAALPVLLVLAWLGQKLSWRILPVLLAPIVLLIGWQYANYVHLGQWPIQLLGSYVERLGYREVGMRERAAASVFIFLGGTLVFPVMTAILLMATAPWMGAISGIVAMGFLFRSPLLEGYSVPARLLVVTCFGLGVALATGALASLLRRMKNLRAEDEREDVFLLAWFLLLLGAILVLYSVGSNRYLLPLAPPLVLLSFRHLEGRLGDAWMRGLCVLALLWNLFWAVSLARADYEFAGAYRAYAQRLAERGIGSRTPLYFSGDWGFRHYLGEIGGQILSVESEPVAGAWVVRSRLCLSRRFDDHLEGPVVPVETESIRLNTPWRLLDRPSHAGFYSTGWGLLPWSWSREALDVVTLSNWSPFYFALDHAQLKKATTDQVYPTRIFAEARSQLVFLQTAGSTVTYALRLPGKPRLRFALFAEAPTTAAPVRFRVAAGGGKTFAIVFDQEFRAGGGDQRFSKEVEVPLTSWAGRAVELRFSVEGQARRAGWAGLTLTGE